MRKTFILIDADEIVSDIKRASNKSLNPISKDVDITYDDTIITLKKGTIIDYISEEEIERVTEEILNNKIKEVKERLDVDTIDDILFFFTTRVNFRKDISEEYKKKSNKTYCSFSNPIIREFIFKKYNCYEIETLEADDLISIYSEHLQNKYKDCNVVISSQDKDMNTISNVYIYNDSAIDDDNIFYFNSNKNSVFYYLSQLLSGDVADGVTNTPKKITNNKILQNGYNKKGAFNLLNDLISSNYSVNDMFYFIKNLYIKNNLEEQFFINCKLLKLLTSELYNKDKKTALNYTENELINYLNKTYYK